MEFVNEIREVKKFGTKKVLLPVISRSGLATVPTDIKSVFD